ncbi:amino acid ABC transporter ATP-binding protein [Bifidobacterium tsurumiense]|uniref:Glutamine transport ATP-binding protein glnQ n=1 Tax=Bifidobacterium tsurumiense TaxID=356829 RepID=A0A087E9J1_9BIFI|nr:amino acid ABC transporter ATP-binding protein [Bifidobacterium tsurumiense]KFJ04442.1 glutamine transport ATP-binding protein glnQ [Bifidobacterium tsurumiense]MDY4678485.1 amino acid ABC transporter ATP-binding protein [Bifidobacterium tsurumiense]MSS13315.1 amino acid ABC transporter ATP-binding protein [Bifidobacterium tsurumiense]
MTERLNVAVASAEANRPELEIRHLLKQYDNADKPVLNDISFSVPKGKVFVVLGPSGSGKSTLLRTIAGLEPIQGGEIVLGDEVIGQGDPASGKSRRAGAAGVAGQSRSSELRTRVGMVFQSYDLFPNKTVLGNVMMAPTLVQKRNKEEVKREAIELLERVGLADRQDAWPHELSGGQRQRVAICRALILHPQIMLFDEVTAALDPEMVREVLDVIVELADQGLTMMIVTHEMAFARAIADHILLLDGGKIVEESDDAEAFFEHPETERAQQFLKTFSYSRNRQEGDR